MALLDSTSLYYTLPWLYLTLHHSTTLYRGSTWLYITLPHSTVALLDSTSLYHTLPWLYLTLHHSTTLYCGATWLYLSVPHSTMSLLDTEVYHGYIPYFTTFYLYRELCIQDKYIERPKRCTLYTLFLTVYKDSPPVNPPVNGDISTFSTVDICPANPPVNDTRVNSEPHYRPTHQQWNSCDQPTHQHHCPSHQQLMHGTPVINPPINTESPTTVPHINNEDLLSIVPNDTGDTQPSVTCSCKTRYATRKCPCKRECRACSEYCHPGQACISTTQLAESKADMSCEIDITKEPYMPTNQADPEIWTCIGSVKLTVDAWHWGRTTGFVIGSSVQPSSYSTSSIHTLSQSTPSIPAQSHTNVTLGQGKDRSGLR